MYMYPDRDEPSSISFITISISILFSTSGVIVTSDKFATCDMDANASPLNPNVFTVFRSLKEAIFDVA